MPGEINCLFTKGLIPFVEKEGGPEGVAALCRAAGRSRDYLMADHNWLPLSVANELVRVAMEGAGALEHWARPEALAATHRPNRTVHILSPFDPLVLQRKRLHLFFDYEHRFEAYLPREKRRYGYFTHPVLVGEEIAALLDLKADRERRKLLIQRWTWLGPGSRRRQKEKIEEALHRFERFQLAP